MLILSRRVGESVMIGDDVAITVLRVKGNQVRLGVNAPRSISVQREEISNRVKMNAAGTMDHADAGVDAAAAAVRVTAAGLAR